MENRTLEDLRQGLLDGVVGVLLAAVWAAALVLAGPALLKLCISYLFF